MGWVGLIPNDDIIYRLDMISKAALVWGVLTRGNVFAWTLKSQIAME